MAEQFLLLIIILKQPNIKLTYNYNLISKQLCFTIADIFYTQYKLYGGLIM